jgi:uncharacterized protein YkwD
MIKKLFIHTAALRRAMLVVTALTALSLAACNGQAPASAETITPPSTDTPVPIEPAAITEAPAATESPTALPGDVASTETSATLPTATATVGTPFPTNPPDCTNSASFVADITIPDNTNVAGGTTFTKTWRINNNGTCVWGPDYTLTHYSDETLGAPVSVPLGVTYPGQNLDISVNLTAPNSIGTHRGNFVIKNPAGLIMSIADDSRLWVIINVTVTTAATANATATTTAPSNTAIGSMTPTSTSSASISSATASGSSASIATCAFTTDRAKLTETITAINTYRAQNGRPAYTINPLLAQAAQRHANDIACNHLFVHTGSDGSTPQTRVAATGYIASSISENVNGNNPPFTGQEVLNWWINDKGDVRHGQNLLSTTFTEIGVGYSFFEDYGFYVIVFAKPRS